MKGGAEKLFLQLKPTKETASPAPEQTVHSTQTLGMVYLYIYIEEHYY